MSSARQASGAKAAAPLPQATPGTAKAAPRRRTDSGQKINSVSALYFSAIATNSTGPDLFTLMDGGTPQPIPVRTDPSANFGSDAGEGGGFRELNNNLYFFADTAGDFGDLFQMNTAGVKTIVPGVNSTMEDGHFTYLNHALYFRGLTAGGDELARLDGDGTVTPIDINQSGNGNAFPGRDGGFGAFHGRLYFSAETAATGEDLFRLDAGSTTPVPIEIDPGPQGSFAGMDNGYFVYNDLLYFNAFVAPDGQAEMMHVSPGNDVAFPVRDATGTIIPHNFGLISSFAEFAGSLYTEESNPATLADTVVKVDTTGVATVFQYQGFDLENAGLLGGFVEFNNELYFSASTPATAYDLFKIDAAGNITALNLTNSGAFDAFNGNNPGGFVVYNNALYLDVYTASDDELIKIDTSGTVTTVLNSGTTMAGAAGGYKEFVGNLYFSAFDSVDGYELFRLDPAGALTHYNINTDATGNSEPGNPGGFAVFPGGEPGNTAPLAVDDTYFTDEDTVLTVPVTNGVLNNDLDAEQDPLTATVVDDPMHGMLSFNTDGSFTYTPDADYNGTDTFTYKANDGMVDSNVATVNLIVNAVNDPPSFTKGPDQTALANSGPQVVDPWATNISPGPPDESGQLLTFNVSNNNGAIFAVPPSIDPNGVLSYTPAAATTGTATVSVSLSDNGSNTPPNSNTSADQSFTITVISRDLTAVKTNDVGNVSATGSPWNWSITLSNSGTNSSTFGPGQVVLRDNLPNANISYGTPFVVDNMSCAIDVNFDLVCTATGGGLTIAPGGSVGVLVPVTGASAAGSFVNPRAGGGCAVDPDGVVPESNEGNNTCSDTVNVSAPPSVVKSFTPAAVSLNGVSTLSIAITAPAANPGPLTGISFTDSFPPGLQVAAAPMANNSCGGVFTTMAGAPTVSLGGGVTLAPGASCTVSVNVTPTTTGAKLNSVTVNSIEGGASTPATATLNVGRAPLDFDGDSISDYAVVRDSGSPRPADGSSGTRGSTKSAEAGPVHGGSIGPMHRGLYFKLPGERFDPLAPRLGRTDGSPVDSLRWLIHTSGPGADIDLLFGTVNDFPVPADYDGDGKCDIAVWTGGPTAQFRVLTSSSNFTATVVYTLGNGASDPSVVGDYDGDGKADPAVFNVNTGQWSYLGGATHSTLVTVTPVGTVGGVFPIPGDFDGDGKFDYMMEARDGINPTMGHFYEWLNDGSTTPPPTTNFTFGNYRDVVVPGDYDGDGTTDVGLASVIVNPVAWRIRTSPAGTLIGPVMFGDPNNDYTITGDYNGDQKGEITVWHPAIGQFQSLLAPDYTAPTLDFTWGQSGDYPVAYFNSH